MIKEDNGIVSHVLDDEWQIWNWIEQKIKEAQQQISVEPGVKPEIAALKKMKQEYLRWLTLPRYQLESSDEYYADIQAITEHLQSFIDNLR